MTPLPPRGGFSCTSYPGTDGRARGGGPGPCPVSVESANGCSEAPAVGGAASGKRRRHSSAEPPGEPYWHSIRSSSLSRAGSPSSGISASSSSMGGGEPAFQPASSRSRSAWSRRAVSDGSVSGGIGDSDTDHDPGGVETGDPALRG